MDSLLANYASSDDEEQEQPPPPTQPPLSVSAPQRSELPKSSSSSETSTFLSSLPPSKSSSLFQSLPQPKQSSKPSLPTGFFENDKNEDVEEGDSLSGSKLGTASIKPSSIFSSLPRPKGNPTRSSSSTSSSRFDGDGDENLTESASMFSSLPQPNSQNLQKSKSNPSSTESQPKRVVLFKPPVNSSLLKLGEDDDDDDDEEEEEIRRRKASQSSFQTPTVTSFLSSIPAPKHSATLGVMSSSGSGRRSILETDVPVASSDGSKVVNDSGSTQKVDHDAENYGSYVNYNSGVEQNIASHTENYDNAAVYNVGTEQNAWNYASYDSYGSYHYSVGQNVVGEAPSVSSGINAGDYGSYENYGNYADHIQYGSDPADQPAMMDAANVVRIHEKRRRNEIPSEILEVKQDELMKNRPRQDQVKLTGIAFGPSYQPASSTKGKPSKLHKRKHQITSLFYDMKQKETELAERRARGLLTKAETQAKYGW
ncbi:ubiquitin carboxyl-terminal hydrolase 36 [Cucurbita maxima]|uniref:Ubiquitin carboxyl-terminal hydrolase 36 n=1 Tax=Cucurbita maxima TaxID=3661 RepID=A0A6J1KT25_CUCMA|nr:ubiquitin carboxyl-terminal hydrolase 36 [Cucurbita maxima]